MQHSPAIQLLKDGFRPNGTVDRPETDAAGREKVTPDHGAILCRTCGHAITHEKERFTVQGAHQHTFANPHGLVFEIGCFQMAPGCTHEGPLTAEFSWFSGFQWKIALCGGCLTHLGWLFISPSNRFSGLIIDRLASRLS